MIKELTKLANHLDSRGLRKEANRIDKLIIKLSDESVELSGKSPSFRSLKKEFTADKYWWKDESNKKTIKAHKQIVRWNKRWLNNYAPGSMGTKKIIPYIKWSSFNNKEALSGMTDDQKYKWYWETKLKSWLTIKLPGAVKPWIDFEWEPGIKDSYGANGLYSYWGGDEVGGYDSVSQIKIDPNYWAKSNRFERKWLVEHELEHAIDYLSIQGVTTSLEGAQTLSGNFKGKGGELEPAVGVRYIGAFASFYLPKELEAIRDDWADEVESQYDIYEKWYPDADENTLWSMVQKAEDKKLFTGFLPLNLGWGAGSSDQRSEMRIFLSRNGGVMTERLMEKLCSAKNKITNYEWTKRTKDQKIKFLLSIKKKAIDPSVLVYLNCENPKEAISTINEMANSGKPMSEKFDRGSEPTNDGGSFLA